MDQPGLSTGFQAGPQVAHGDFDDVGQVVRLPAPDVLQQLRPTDDALWIAHQVRQ
jgi:hypothetical protein